MCRRITRSTTATRGLICRSTPTCAPICDSQLLEPDPLPARVSPLVRGRAEACWGAGVGCAALVPRRWANTHAVPQHTCVDRGRAEGIGPCELVITGITVITCSGRSGRLYRSAMVPRRRRSGVTSPRMGISTRTRRPQARRILSLVLIVASVGCALPAAAEAAYGAIAVNHQTGGWGVAYNAPAQWFAERQALRKCHGECTIAVWVQDACAAVVRRGRAMISGWAETKSGAIEVARRHAHRLRAGVIAWLCSG
jgi:Domain of unknown function (DUF4189)